MALFAGKRELTGFGHPPDLELADHMSRSALREGGRQHDLFLTLGLVSRRLGLAG